MVRVGAGDASTRATRNPLAEAKKPRQVADELNCLEKKIAELKGIIFNLEGDLEPVLEDVPAETEKPEGEEMALVPLANNIRTVRKSITELQRQLVSLIKRIQL